MDELKNALSRLDPKNDEHWTADGVPRVDVVSAMLGRAVTRKEIIDADPKLVRASSEPSPAADEQQPSPSAEDLREQALAEARDVAASELEQSLALAAEIAELQKAKAEIDARHARALAVIDRLGPTAEAQDRDNIRQYLANQHRRREAHQKRIAGVLQDGVKVRDVLAAVNGRSALDNAMAHRKAPLGAMRPAPRAPAPSAGE